MSKKPVCEICLRSDCPGWQDRQPVHEYRGKGSWFLGCHCEGCAKARNESGGFFGALADHLSDGKWQDGEDSAHG